MDENTKSVKDCISVIFELSIFGEKRLKFTYQFLLENICSLQRYREIDLY